MLVFDIETMKWRPWHSYWPQQNNMKLVTKEIKDALEAFVQIIMDKLASGTSGLPEFLRQTVNEYQVALPQPKRGLGCAEQCVEMGIVIGDTIEGREEYGKLHSGFNPAGGWNDARITLLWKGKSEAVWEVWRRTNTNPNWSRSGEQSNWHLDSRPWRKVTQLVCVGCGLLDIQEPTVVKRPDGKTRCADCQAKWSRTPIGPKVSDFSTPLREHGQPGVIKEEPYPPVNEPGGCAHERPPYPTRLISNPGGGGPH